MKHLLIILISFLLLSSPVIGDNHKGETLYRWDTSSGIVWRGFGDKEVHSVYKGEVKNGKPNGLGIIIDIFSDKYVGKFKDGKENGYGTYTWFDGRKYVGEHKDGRFWNGTQFSKNGDITYKWVNGNYIKQ